MRCKREREGGSEGARERGSGGFHSEAQVKSYDRNTTLFKRNFESIVRWVSQTIFYDRSAVAF